MTRLITRLRALIFRQLSRFGFWLFNNYNRTSSPTYSRWIDSTLSSAPGEQRIKIDIWDSPPRSSTALRPCVVTLHAGGFVMGRATDDSLWIAYVQSNLDAVAIGVNYRLAPRYLFPTAVEDVVDALLWISDHAEGLGIDTSKVIITGFSAGGNLAVSSLYLLHRLASDSRVKCGLDIRGIISFYPVLDYTVPRPQKIASCTRPDLCLSKTMTDMCDESYVPGARDRMDPRLSPSHAPDDFLLTLPEIHFCLAEYDMLAQEALDFKDRLKKLRPDMDIECRVTKGVQHAFDKPPRMKPRDEVGVEYAAAMEAIKRWLL